MLKKALAILLSITMLFSVTGVFAAVTTDSTGGTLKTDDFEQHNIAADTEYDGTTFTSDVFSLFGNGITPKGTIVYNGGKDGSKALKLSNASTSLLISLSAVTGSTEYGVLSFDMKAGYNTSTKTVELGGRNQYGTYPVFKLGYDSANQLGTIIKGSDDTVIATYSNDKWYKVVLIYKINGAKDGWIIDETGNIIATASNSRGYSGSLSCITSNAAIDIIVDNAELRHYDTTKDAPKITTAPSISGSTSVNTNISSITVVTDQPIAVSSSTATLTATGDSKTCTITQDTTKYNTYTISWEAPLLGTTPYTLDLSGLKNSSGLTVGSSGIYTFTTAEEEIIADVASSNPANGEVDVSVDTKSMTVTFNTEMTAPETVSLTGGSEAITAAVTSTDNKTFTFTWTEEPAGLTTYSVSLADFEDAGGAAPTTTSVSFTTESTEIVTLTDSFENASYINSGKTSYFSDLISMAAASTGTDVDEVTQVSGFKTGNALQFKTGTANAMYLNPVQSTSEYDFSSDKEMYVATWRFRLDQMATYDTANSKSGARIAIGGVYDPNKRLPDYSRSAMAISYEGGKLVAWAPYDGPSTQREVSEDKWYNITYVMGKNTEAIYFVDAATGEIIYQRQGATLTRSECKNTDDYLNRILLVGASRTKGSTPIVNDNQTFTIDDFTLWKIKPERTNHKLTLAGEVAESDGTFTFNFSQPVIADEDMFALYLEDADGDAGALKNELAYSIPSIKHTDFCQQEISFSDLQNYTNYTLDYSGVTAVSGADLGDAKAASLIEFTTEPESTEISVVGSVSCNGLTEGSTITAKLYSKQARNADIIAAFYNRSFPESLSSAQIVESVSLSQGVNDITITLDKDIEAQYIRLYAWDGISTMVPLMKECEALAPVDSLDVLMIGNSLSEDAQRYLNNMASAGGLDLNLTVKGVGGSTLTHHMSNLKSELEAGLDTKYNTDTAAVGEYITAAGDNTDRILYFTYENGVKQEDETDKLLIPALLEKQYDVISLQQFSAYTDADFEESLPYLTAKIRELQPNAEIVLYQTWSAYSGNQTTRLSNFIDTIEPTLDKWAAQVGANVDNITVNGESIKIIPAGHAFYLADTFHDWCGERFGLTAGNTEASAQTEAADWLNTATGLWRDVNHASYYGCYLADAVWYESLTGKRAPVTDAQGDAIVPIPTGVGPVVETDGENVTITEDTTTYFTQPTKDEHIAKLQQLSDIAHRIVLLNNN